MNHLKKSQRLYVCVQFWFSKRIYVENGCALFCTNLIWCNTFGSQHYIFSFILKKPHREFNEGWKYFVTLRKEKFCPHHHYFFLFLSFLLLKYNFPFHFAGTHVGVKLWLYKKCGFDNNKFETVSIYRFIFIFTQFCLWLEVSTLFNRLLSEIAKSILSSQAKANLINFLSEKHFKKLAYRESIKSNFRMSNIMWKKRKNVNTCLTLFLHALLHT